MRARRGAVPACQSLLDKGVDHQQLAVDAPPPDKPDKPAKPAKPDNPDAITLADYAERAATAC